MNHIASMSVTIHLPGFGPASNSNTVVVTAALVAPFDAYGPGNSRRVCEAPDCDCAAGTFNLTSPEYPGQIEQLESCGMHLVPLIEMGWDSEALFSDEPVLANSLQIMERLMEAVALQSQPLTLSGMVTPESPGGQLTATRANGQRVDRHDFLRDATRGMRRLIEATQREQSRKAQ